MTSVSAGPSAGVTIRPATSADLPRIAEIVHGEPGTEAAALCGSVEAARRIGERSIRRDGLGSGNVVVAERNGCVVGVLAYGLDGDTRLARPRLATVWNALRVLGPFRFVPWVRGTRARRRAQPGVPRGTFYVSEIDVDASARGQGVGGALLDWAEREATRLGRPSMTLRVTIGNPAERLYARKGFFVAHVATDAAFNRITGAPGRVLMEKHLIARVDTAANALTETV